MSKKKAFTGNTMTLKDFHGGSIPSDLPLPSAPGVIVKPSDRPGYDRSSSWGNSIGGRPDHRSRPNSSQSTRHFDDKTAFLAHSSHIGRNFDEDERKPLDGVSAPRRTVSDEVIQAPPSRVEVNPESVSIVGRLSGWHGLTPVASPLPSGTAGSYLGRVAEGTHVSMSSSNSRPNSGHAISRPYPNAWATRKEVQVVGVAEPVQPAWSQESAVSKLAHASALEKVSSGRWQTKQSVHYQTDVEVVRHSEPETENCLYNRVDGAAGLREYNDARLASLAERSLSIQNEIQGDRKESPDTERARAPMINSDGVQPVLHSEYRVGASELQAVVPLEPSERPKLKLLPRKKPLESPEQPIVDHHQVYQRHDSSHAEIENESNRNMNIGKPGLAGTDSSTQVLARPKLNLKPRSQPVEKHQEKIERGRNALFGGARPREMVLRERGIDDVVIINNELGQDSDRVKPNSPSTERVPMHRGEHNNRGSGSARIFARPAIRFRLIRRVTGRIRAEKVQNRIHMGGYRIEARLYADDPIRPRAILVGVGGSAQKALKSRSSTRLEFGASVHDKTVQLGIDCTMEGGQQTQNLGEGDSAAGGIEVAAGGVGPASGGVQVAAALAVEQEAAASGIISRPLPTSLKKTRRTSDAWDHFNEPVRNSAGEVYASCKYCGKSYKCDPRTCGTSNLKWHAGKCARNPAKKVDKSQGTIPYTSVPLGSVELSLNAWKFNQVVIRDALAKMLVLDELPFRFVHREGFTNFMKACCPQFTIPVRTTMRRDAHDLYNYERVKMLTFFRSKSPRVSLTTDTWTSGQQINYMCLTAHFIDEDWVLHKKIINFCQIHGHKGEDIGMTLEYCLRDWGIDKVLAVTVDNASANEPAVQHLVRKFNTLGTNILSGRLMHMRCMAHIINLIVSDGIGQFLPSIDRIRAAVKYVRSSPSRLSRFRTCVIDCGLDPKALLTLDVCTRWNATYLMLLSAVKVEAAFERYDREDETFRKEMSKILQKGSKEPLGILCDHDWVIVKSFLPFLKHFYDLTCRVSGSSYVTSNMFFEEMNDTLQLIKKGLMGGNDHHMISVAEKMKLKFDKYWTDLSKINVLIFLASVFDPRNKLQVVKYGIECMYDEHDAYALSLSVKDTLYEMFDEYVKLHSTDSIGEPSPQSSTTNLVEDDARGSLLRAAFKRCKSSLDSVIKSELDKYLSEDVEEDVAKFNLLDWWKCNSPRFPILSIMARDILAVPISTVSSESAFSAAGRIVDDYRSSLTPRTIEALICLQDWIRSSTSKITFVEDHQEIEEFEAELDAT